MTKHDFLRDVAKHVLSLLEDELNSAIGFSARIGCSASQVRLATRKQEGGVEQN